MSRKRPSRKPQTDIPQEIDCGGPCAFTKPDKKPGQVTVTIKTTTLEFNALEILQGGKNALAAISSAVGGTVARELKDVIGEWAARKIQ